MVQVSWLGNPMLQDTISTALLVAFKDLRRLPPDEYTPVDLEDPRRDGRTRRASAIRAQAALENDRPVVPFQEDPSRRRHDKKH